MYLFRKSKGRKCIKSRRTFKKTKSTSIGKHPGKIGRERPGRLASGADWPEDPPAILRGNPLHQSGFRDSLGMPGFPAKAKAFAACTRQPGMHGSCRRSQACGRFLARRWARRRPPQPAVAVEAGCGNGRHDKTHLLPQGYARTGQPRS